MAIFNVVSLVYLVIVLAIFGISVYCMILFVKLAKRGIRALDIYINEKTNYR